MIKIELTDKEAEEFKRFREKQKFIKKALKYYKEIQLLFNCQAFELERGNIILHKNDKGELAKIEINKIYKGKKT